LLQPYHYVWLAAHEHRTEAWLRKRMQDGFDIHHLDGNHGNNDPLNLVLIETTDHMMLHSGKRMLGRLTPKKGKRGPQKNISRAKIERAFQELRVSQIMG
jgi:hypothetical protein